MGDTNDKPNTSANDEPKSDDGIHSEFSGSSDSDNTQSGATVPEPKRGRGRPPKSDTGTFSGTTSAKFAREKRSEKPEQKSSKGVDVKKLAKQIKGVHLGLAMLLKNPIFQLQENESEDLAVAIKEVLQYHEITINPRLMAYGELIAVSAAIYAPRIIISINSSAKNKAQKQVMEKVNPQPHSPMETNINAPVGVMKYQ
jgi:hypothetical protein